MFTAPDNMKSLTKVILSKGFEFLKTDNKGSALFKKNKHYMTYYRNGKTTIIDNKSNYVFNGYLETSKELDCLLKMLRI